VSDLVDRQGIYTTCSTAAAENIFNKLKALGRWILSAHSLACKRVNSPYSENTTLQKARQLSAKLTPLHFWEGGTGREMFSVTLPSRSGSGFDV